tara:strand:- start:939 stop:1448 length:510 start_codon:yes stop_codon:yes gene_type:complete
MKGQYTFYLIIQKNATTRISDRYDWQTFTYKDVEKTGTRVVNVALPTEDDLKSEIQAFMDTHSISGSGTKAELITAIDEWLMDNNHPTESESYTYTTQEVDVTTDHEAKVDDMVERHPLYFAKREAPDASEYCIKSDLTFTELKALPSSIKVFTNEEVKSYISENWVEE